MQWPAQHLYFGGAHVVVRYPDGSVEIKCGTQDIGCGTRTHMAVVAAETLGLDPGDYMADSYVDLFFAQGGDWGSLITQCLAQSEVAHCAGVHVNMPLAAPDPDTLERDFLAREFPAPAGAPAPAEGAALDQGEEAQPIRVRMDFNPLATFAPEVRTDANGQAQVAVTVPDNLTRYRVMVVAVAGDFEPAELEVLLNTTVGSLETLAEPLPAIPQPDHTPEPGVYVVNKPDVNQGRVSIGRPAFRLGHPDQFPLTVGNDILGGYGFTARMMKRIRSDEGLAYSAGSRFDRPVLYEGTFRSWFQTKHATAAFGTRLPSGSTCAEVELRAT